MAITEALVGLLLRQQHPDLADLPITAAASGWDNEIYRLGDDLAVRLPRRRAAATLIEHEQRWLPELAGRLPIPVPAPVRLGVPAAGYPWSWSVTPWFHGVPATDTTLGDPTREAARLGAFMAALHRPAPPDAPRNPSRDVFVGDRSATFVASVERIGDLLDELASDGARRAIGRWGELVDVPPHALAPAWVAGDVHAANLVVRSGEIAAVIDFGDLCAGDPAVDLAVGWMLFDEADRATFRVAAGDGPFAVDDPMWQRAEAWALLFSVLYLANSADDDRLAGMGRTLFAALMS